jgi:ABC-2 type transport system ATP-binding protein
MLIIKDLQVQLGAHEVLKHLNLEIAAGTIHGLVGLNGSGKTTLLNTLYAYNKPKTGQINWDNAPLSRKKVAFLETENYFYPAITGREYLSVFPDGYENGFDLDVWAELFQLPVDEWVDHYSTGMRKKLAFLSVLKSNKPLFLMDEPFNGMDMESNFILREILLKLKEQHKTILVTSHIMETLTPVCDQIHYLQDGHILKSVLPAEFADFESVLRNDAQKRHEDLLNRAL